MKGMSTPFFSEPLDGVPFETLGEMEQQFDAK